MKRSKVSVQRKSRVKALSLRRSSLKAASVSLSANPLHNDTCSKKPKARSIVM